MAELWDTAAFGTGSPAEMSGQPSGINGLVGGLYDYLGGLAKRAIGNSAQAVQGGDYNPAPVMEAAMLPMGTGAVAGVPVKGAETVLGAGPIRAYHGSPHDFDKFDLSKIGTGEGAQAYGHGLYFAENPQTAQAYRDQLSGRPVTLPSVDSPHFQQSMREAIANNAVQVAGKDVELAKRSLTERINGYPAGSNARRDYEAALDMLHETPSKFAGRMYEVNINADPARFLDWDKGGKKIYNDAMDSLPKNLTIPQYGPLTAKALADQGIPGIKYLDQGSRGTGEGTNNFVVFNDKLIDIMRKYGIALPGGAAAADAYTTRSHEPAT